MWALDSVLALGKSPGYPERLARHIRISNGVALLGAALAIASVPFDLMTGPPWFLLSDLTALSGSLACLLLNARGHPHVARVLMLSSLNLVFLHATMRLGEQSEQHAVFFALSIAPFFVFSLEERRFLIPFIILPVVEYFVADYGQWGPAPQFSVAAYRVYSAVLAFTGLIGGLSVFARITNRAERAMRWQQHVLDETRARSIAAARMTALGEMSSGVAHEIRNPLTAINLAAGQITEHPSSPESVAATAERIQRAAKRISTIIDSLLAFSRDAGGDPLVDVRLEQLFGETLTLCHSRFAEHHIELQVPPVAPGLVVQGRATQLQQVLLNLLSNAHDAVETEPAPWVRLDARRADGWVEIAVTDSGTGVPPQYRDRIFEPFFTTKALDRGTGLGLSLSRGIVEEHHGTLTLDPRAPHTRFVVRLPLQPDAQPRVS
jgi:signal transduction histidine kinase